MFKRRYTSFPRKETAMSDEKKEEDVAPVTSSEEGVILKGVGIIVLILGSLGAIILMVAEKEFGIPKSVSVSALVGCVISGMVLHALGDIVHSADVTARNSIRQVRLLAKISKKTAAEVPFKEVE
jgi:hypothetical protein